MLVLNYTGNTKIGLCNCLQLKKFNFRQKNLQYDLKINIQQKHAFSKTRPIRSFIHKYKKIKF
jgi:hypothetical protein